jgi:heptosyltransferase II
VGFIILAYLSSMNAIVSARPWKSKSPPRKILIMRFQALGDTIITLPYLLSLKRQYPNCLLHLLTREEVSPIPKGVELFDRVVAIKGGRNAKIQFILSMLLLPMLWLQRYDAVLDLQNHKMSKILRILLFTKAWAQFDTTSPISAGERTKQTIEALWKWKVNIFSNFIIKVEVPWQSLLMNSGWKQDHDLVVLNPAGFFSSRNWPLENYIAFAKQWLEQINPKTQFVLLLLPTIKEKAAYLAQALGESCINLTGKPNQVEAFAILQRCKFVLSEDSGLTHMAWVQGIPTLALFGSSRKDWSSPQGDWSACLDSSDLECGPCGLEVCKFGDNRCLTRYSPNFVLNRGRKLISKGLDKNRNIYHR